MVKFFLTRSPSQTKKLGEILAQEILKTKIKSKKTAFVIGLEGDLGGGKTTFLQGFSKGLGIKEKILSPSFIIMKKFKIPAALYSNSSGFAYFYHIDCYRIEKPKEILNLGLKKIISNPKNIIAVEWADRIRKILPKETCWIKFNFIRQNIRQISIKSKAIFLWRKRG